MPRGLGGRVPRPLVKRSSADCILRRTAACRPNFQDRLAPIRRMSVRLASPARCRPSLETDQRVREQSAAVSRRQRSGGLHPRAHQKAAATVEDDDDGQQEGEVPDLTDTSPMLNTSQLPDSRLRRTPHTCSAFPAPEIGPGCLIGQLRRALSSRQRVAAGPSSATFADGAAIHQPASGRRWNGAYAIPSAPPSPTF